MKSVLIAAAVAAVAVATPALAQTVVTKPASCTQFYNASCPDTGNSYIDGSYDRDWQNVGAVMSNKVPDANAYRYHGGPKYND